MNSLKELNEKRDAMVNEMETILTTAKNETRSMNEEELSKFDTLEKGINEIDASIKAEERASKLNIERGKEKMENEKQLSKEEAEERAFVNFIRNNYEEIRAGEIDFTKANNTAIIPETISKRVFSKIIEICPIAEKATRYNIGGKLSIPYYGPDGANDITVGFSEEMAEAQENAGKFTTISLTDNICQALTLVSKELINNASFDVVSYIVNKVSEKIAQFLEAQLLIGTTGKTEGAVSTTNTLTSLAANAVSIDDLIKLQAMVKTPYQSKACWVMNRETFTAICLLKDGNNRPIVMQDYSSTFPYVMLGRPVYVSDNMPKIASGAKTVLYGDFSAMALKFSQTIKLEILREKYITRHAIGVYADFEMDCKVCDAQGLAVLVQA